jgi:DNA-binding response OmpR family regulator
MTQDDKLIGYESGADMYLTKPVEMNELRAAFRSFARRRQATMQHVTAQTLTLNKLDLKGSAGSIKLSIQEATVLTAMARAPAGKLRTWQIAELLEVEPDESFKSSLAVRMVRLRKKLKDSGAEGVAIESLRNYGYQLTTIVEII